MLICMQLLLNPKKVDIERQSENNMLCLFDITEDAQRYIFSRALPLSPLTVYNTSKEAREWMTALVTHVRDDQDFRMVCAAGDMLSLLCDVLPHDTYTVTRERALIGLSEAFKVGNTTIMDLLFSLPVAKGDAFFQPCFSVACSVGSYKTATAVAVRWGLSQRPNPTKQDINVRVFIEACRQENTPLLAEMIPGLETGAWRPCWTGLFNACEQGNERMFNFFFQYISDELDTNSMNTILGYALEGGGLAIVSTLLGKGATYVRGIQGDLCYTAYTSMVDLTPILTLVPAFTPELLDYAATTNNVSFLKRVIDQSPVFYVLTQQDIDSSFRKACSVPNIEFNGEVIQYLLSLGASDYNSALMSGCEQLNIPLVKELLYMGANVYSEALKYVCGPKSKFRDQTSNAACVELAIILIDDAPTGTDFDDAFDGAVRNRRLELVNLIIDKGDLSVECLNKYLYQLSIHGFSDSVKRIITKGATDVNEALRLASAKAQSSTIEILIENGADNLDVALLMLCYFSENTPRAVQRSEIARLLIQKGASVIQIALDLCSKSYDEADGINAHKRVIDVLRNSLNGVHQ